MTTKRKRRLICDLETNGHYHTVTRIHLYLFLDIDTQEVFVYREKDWEQARSLLTDAELLIFHNGINYDLAVLEKLHPGFQTDAQIRDTLIMSRLIFSDIKEADFELFHKKVLPGKLIGSHGLKGWGYRLGVLKGDYGDEVDAWDEWSQEMEDYGVQDLYVTLALWNHILRQIERTNYSIDAIVFEHRFADLMSRVERNGFHFDEDGAKVLYSELCDERERVTERLKVTFRPWWKPARWAKGQEWRLGETTTPARTINYKDVLNPSRTAGAPFTPIYLEEFNPGSRPQIADRLQRMFGWKPKEFTETGRPKVSEDVLRDLVGELDEEEDGVEESEDELYQRFVDKIPQAKDLADFFLIQKRIGQLAEGKNGWLKLVRDGKIHGSVNTLGAVTRRVTHAKPNTSQVPAVRSPYGKRMRALWYTPARWLQFGCDLSGIEIRCFANALAEFDGGDYGRLVIEGDVHTANATAFGITHLPNFRDISKTTLYALLYGAGDAKLGSIINSGADAGKRIKQNFMRAVPAYKNVVQKLQRQADRQGWIPALDGGRLHVRSAHKALNTSLQSAGALVAKFWLMEIEDILIYEKGWKHGWDGEFAQLGMFHDEGQYSIYVPESFGLRFEDDYDYSTVTGKDAKDIESNIKKLKAKRLLNWYTETFPQVRIMAEATKTAIKRAEEHFNFRCPLDCEYIVGHNWADCH